jgi:hypothetical protein
MSDQARYLVHELHSDGISIRRKGSASHAGALQVSFERTVRVSDNDTENDLPPGLGSFPLFEASAYKDLPSAMKAKGGYFLPMHRMYFSSLLSYLH